MRQAPLFDMLPPPEERPALVVFLETDCPTCRLIAPYLNRLPPSRVVGVSQDAPVNTEAFVRRLALRFPLFLDNGWELSRVYNPETVPALYVVGADGEIIDEAVGFDKAALNRIGRMLGIAAGIAPPFDGNPDFKPGCMSRHREPLTPGESAPALEMARAAPASRTVVDDAEDDWEYCMRVFGDALPVVPPTEARVARMLAACSLPAHEVIAHIPPSYGAATVEKIAANAVMAGCEPKLLNVLIPLIRAACDERFNLHGVQATTHFAAPLIILNGPIRRELGFATGGNVFSNVARANSTLGRAFQLILTNIGGARPGEIDMSTLGNMGKFSWCIAENEEASPWEPLHVEHGLEALQSAVTLFAGDGVRGVSEHTARNGTTVLKAIAATLATVWTWRACLSPEALVVLCPEHLATLHRDGFTKAQVREFLYENTGVPVRAYAEDDGGEGTQLRSTYTETTIGGERCYRKFRSPDAIQIVVAGGGAGKFSAVIGSWATGPRGSQLVTYPL